MSTAIIERIEELLNHFDGISLDEVQKASLMRRKDCKFLFNVAHVPDILERIWQDYRVLEIGGRRSQNYESYYFDTEDLEMYHMHHRGRVNRYKVRFRKYGNSGVHFLEIKRKNAKGVTIKKRVRTDGVEASILTTEEEFLRKYSPYGTGQMLPSLENRFNRITFVNHLQTERITLDYELRLFSNRNERTIYLPGISVAEIKYENHLTNSAFYESLRCSRIPPSRFSKYAIGMALLHDELKQNLFKPRVRQVHKINQQFLQTIKTTSNA